LLLEVHGQQDDRGLFDTATHRALLDGFRRPCMATPRRSPALHGEWSSALPCWKKLKVGGIVRGRGRFCPRRRQRAFRFRIASGGGRAAGGERPDDECGAVVEEVSSAWIQFPASAGRKPALPRRSRSCRDESGGAQDRSPAETALEQAYAWRKRRGASWIRCCRGWTAQCTGAQEERRSRFGLGTQYGVTPEQLPAVGDDMSPNRKP
jgi:hypothetical protein